MRPVTICITVIISATIAACSVSKKSVPAAPPTPPPPAVTTLPRIAPSVHSADGVFAPGNAELTALQATHTEATMQALQEGYKLYTGVCTNCHMAKSIYNRPEAAWPAILVSMAREASISDAQRDAIYKYVMAVKATQPR